MVQHNKEYDSCITHRLFIYLPLYDISFVYICIWFLLYIKYSLYCFITLEVFLIHYILLNPLNSPTSFSFDTASNIWKLNSREIMG